jgi:hypothetical protein
VTIAGQRVRITGDSQPVRAFRGFFSGDEVGVSHHADSASETVAARAAGADARPSASDPAAGLVTIEIGEARFELHRLPEGWLHSHQMPFQRFRTADEAARALVHAIYGDD